MTRDTQVSHAATNTAPFAPYRPPEQEEDRAPRMPSSGTIALVGLLITIIAFSITIGRAAQALDQKVDQSDYERDIGQIKGDVRVIRSAICNEKPGACQ